MIDVLIQGRLRGGVLIKPSKQGKDYAIFRLGVTDKNGDSILCGCITFEPAAVEAVQRLGDGDSVAVSGEATIRTWPPENGAERLGLDVMVQEVVSVCRKLPGSNRASRPQDDDSAH